MWAQISNALNQVFSVVDHLSLQHKAHTSSQLSEEYNAVDRPELCKLLKSFGNIKTLIVKDGLVEEVTFRRTRGQSCNSCCIQGTRLILYASHNDSLIQLDYFHSCLSWKFSGSTGSAFPSLFPPWYGEATRAYTHYTTTHITLPNLL